MTAKMTDRNASNKYSHHYHHPNHFSLGYCDNVKAFKCGIIINKVYRLISAQYRDLWIATVVALAIATLYCVSQIGLVLCVSLHPR